MHTAAAFSSLSVYDENRIHMLYTKFNKILIDDNVFAVTPLALSLDAAAVAAFNKDTDFH